jgi:hypothetical protein
MVRFARKLGGGSRKEAQVGDRARNLDFADQAQGFAGVAGFRLGELFGAIF